MVKIKINKLKFFCGYIYILTALTLKPFKPFVTFFPNFHEKCFLASFFPGAFKIALKCPFQSFYFLGEDPQMPTCSIESPPIPSTRGVLHRVGSLCPVLSHTKFSIKKKKPKYANFWLKNAGSLITRSAFKSVGIFQWLNPETEKRFL